MYIPIFKANTQVQETVYEASYIVPSTQYDRIEGPKFRRRHVQSIASGTEKVREADFQDKHSSKHRSTQEQVALPFPAGSEYIPNHERKAIEIANSSIKCSCRK